MPNSHKKIQYSISDLYSKHGYLLKKLDKLPNIRVKHFESLASISSNKSTLENSLKLLSELLYEYFNERVYILIDEYDAPFNSMVEAEISETNSVEK